MIPFAQDNPEKTKTRAKNINMNVLSGKVLCKPSQREQT